MNYVTINNHRVYYHESNDPVIYYLKKNILYGASNYNILNKYLRPNSNILDCGGHIGTFSLPAVWDGHHVTIVEGAKDNVECLRETFSEISNAHIVHGMISDIIGPCSFSTTSGPFGHLIKDENGKEQSVTIDVLAHNMKVDGIKLDLEGGEIEALQGAVETIKRDRPVMLVEVNGHCLRQSGRLPQDLLAQIESLDYEAFLASYFNLQITSKQMFPFCVTDILCFPAGQMSARQITEKEIKTLAHSIFLKSNDDCKEYYASIGVY